MSDLEVSMTKPADIRVLTDPDTVRLIADPMRLRLLELLRQRSRTVTELAELLDVPRTRLYYHVKLLEAHDLGNRGKQGTLGLLQGRHRDPSPPAQLLSALRGLRR